MKRDPFSRRHFLRKSIDWSLTGGAAILVASCSKGENASGRKSSDAAAECAADLEAGQLSLRESLNYVDAFDDPEKTCGACAFFTGEGNGACGSCELLSGGPVAKGGHCSSWSPKA